MTHIMLAYSLYVQCTDNAYKHTYYSELSKTLKELPLLNKTTVQQLA